jgi:hypothetical protein
MLLHNDDRAFGWRVSAQSNAELISERLMKCAALIGTRMDGFKPENRRTRLAAV